MKTYYVYIDKSHPDTNLIYATTDVAGVELEKIEIQVDETDETQSIEQIVREKIGV